MHNPKKRIEKLRYLHRNPVSRGLVDKPEDWEWSSFRHYATGMEGVVEIESDWTARQRERMGIPLRVKVRNPGPTLSPEGEKDGARPSISRAWHEAEGRPPAFDWRSLRIRAGERA